MRRYDRVWYDAHTRHHFLVALAPDGFADRARGPYSPDEVRALLGRKRLDGSRRLADQLNQLPPGRLSDVTAQFTA